MSVTTTRGGQRSSLQHDLSRLSELITVIVIPLTWWSLVARPLAAVRWLADYVIIHYAHVICRYQHAAAGFYVISDVSSSSSS